jgi:hypothetical protein
LKGDAAMKTSLFLPLFLLLATANTHDVNAQETEVLSDEQTRISSGNVYSKSVLTHDKDSNKIMSFSFTLTPSDQVNYVDFQALYYELETFDFTKNPRYIWEDVQSGKVSARQWAMDPQNPRHTKKVQVSIPRPEVVIAIAKSGQQVFETLLTEGNLRISIAFLNAEMGTSSRCYRWVDMRIVFEQVN